MGGCAGRRTARRAGRISGERSGGRSGGSGTGAEALAAELTGAEAVKVVGRRVLLRVGRAAMTRRPHLDLSLGRVARTFDVGDGAAVTSRLALVALDAAGPTREAASARASLDLAHDKRLLPRVRGG